MASKLSKVDVKTLAFECLKDRYIWPTTIHNTEDTRDTLPLVFKTNNDKADNKLVLVQVGSRFLSKLSEKEIDEKLLNVAMQISAGDKKYERRLKANIFNMLKAHAINEEEARTIKNTVKDFTNKVSKTNDDIEEIELTNK